MSALSLLAGALGFASSGPFFAPTAGAFAWSPAAAAAAVPALPAERAAPLAHSPSAIVSNLLSSALQWGLASCSEADDVMLALVSPEAYWLLREWRASTFGDQMAIRGMLHAARQDLLRLGKSEEALRGASVSVRTKGLFSTFHKAVVRRQHVHDVLALRVVLRRGASAQGCFDAHERLRARWGSVSGRHKDYVSAPKRNGYQALHDTMVLPSGHEFECQIRTEDMHREAEYGAAAHRRYKGALVRLPIAVLSGVAGASGPGRWPLQPQEALGLAARLSQ